MEIDALLNANAESNQVFDIALTSLEEKNPPENYRTYFSALKNALDKAPPPFDTKEYTDSFVEAAQSGHWMATSLITNSQREGDGATRLWSLSACSSTKKKKDLLKIHAIDESGHSFAYLTLLDLVFPGSVDSEFREELNSLSPQYSILQTPEIVEGNEYARDPSMDDFIQMNIAEIRTTIHHLMQRRALQKFCPDENKKRVTLILDSLMKDEMAHVAYTAKIIEEQSDDFGHKKLYDLYLQRLQDFNNITIQELDKKIFD